MNRYLIKYLRDTAKDSIEKKYIDYFKVELDWYIYRYGDHFAKKQIVLKAELIKIYQQIKTIFSEYKKPDSTNNILSSIYLTDKLFWSRLGYNAYSSILQPVGYNNLIGDKDTVLLKKKIDKIISIQSFNNLYNTELFETIEENQNRDIIRYKKYNFKGLCLYTDQYFESKYLIDIFKAIDRPSLVFSHGLPGIYSLDVDNRSDYLMVWGEKIKENYIKAGFNPDKVKVVGNLKYKNTGQKKVLRNTLENVLVIPHSSILWHQHEWDNVKLVDRSMIVLYLYEVQRVLERMNVKSARFRPHPTFNIDWVYRFIDNNFYVKDDEPLSESFKKSTLIIGATSTTFLEAINAGVNYIIYEPTDIRGKGLSNFKLVPPFDGSEKDIHVANTEDELEYLIKHKYQTGAKCLDGYMQPLDTSVIKSIIK